MTDLTDEQRMLIDTARSWAESECPVSILRRMRDRASTRGYDEAKWREQAEMGWVGAIVPESYGGGGLDFYTFARMVAELGRTLVPTPLASSALAAIAIVKGGSEAQKRSWLPDLASGNRIGTLAIAEGPRGVPAAYGTSVTQGRLSGRKFCVSEGGIADLYVVAASDGLYVVEGQAGVEVVRLALVDSRNHAELTFAEAEAQPLGEGIASAHLADCATALACAELLGLVEAVFEMTRTYLLQRHQFDRPLASFQALQHRMASLFVEIQLMRAAVDHALRLAEAGGDEAARAVSTAKAIASDTANLVTRETIQLHGGIGMTDEYDVGFYLKRSAVLEASWGNAARHRDRFASMAGY